MPTPGYDHQSWMLAEVSALTKALASHTSTQKFKHLTGRATGRRPGPYPPLARAAC
jgi:hypothetical protein